MNTPPALLDTDDQLIRTTLDLRRVQQSFADAASPASVVQSLDLASASGRVLAQDVHVRTQCEDEDQGENGAGLGHWLRAGTRLDWFLLPLLAAGAQATVKVYEPLRCGVLAVNGDGASARVGAALVQGLLERMGVKALGAGVDRPLQGDGAHLSMLARFCDLILVVDSTTSAQVQATEGLQAPPLFEIEGRPCMVLPACPLAALASYVAFAVPLVRRLQGRMPPLPAIRHAIDAASGHERRIATGRLSCVGAGTEGELRVRATTTAGQGLAGITGIGWRAEDLAEAGVVAYLSLGEWLR